MFVVHMGPRRRLVVERYVDTAAISSPICLKIEIGRDNVERRSDKSDRYIFGRIPVRVRFVVGDDRYFPKPSKVVALGTVKRQ